MAGGSVFAACTPLRLVIPENLARRSRWQGPPFPKINIPFMKIRSVFPFFPQLTIVCCWGILSMLPAGGLRAQATDWSAPVRGTWVQKAQPAAGDVVLCRAGTPCEIVVSAAENSAVQQAAVFLADDILKISGSRPPIVATPAADRVSIRLVTLGQGPVPSELDAATLQGQWESYRIATVGRNVWLVGADFRGTAFAAYTLAERLGIDPLYLWTGYRPEHRDPLVLKETRFRAESPAFRFRGCFHDDEDILPRPFDDKGHPKLDGDIPLDWYKRYFETALRLRMNMVVPYTRVHRRFEVQQVASDWGLFYTGQHYDVLVSNPFGFRQFKLAEARGVKPTWNWFTNREGMIKYWQAGIDENRGLNVIWPVGMRGLSDEPFVFPEGMTNEQKAETFRDVIRTQVEMVTRSVPKDKPPVFTFTMYAEMFDYYQKHAAAFDLPANVTVVWIDNNDGLMYALPKEPGRWKHGVYYHLAYWWGPMTKQETHTVTPARIAEQFGDVLKAGATEYMLVNVSEMRDYVMGIRMLSDIGWNAPAIYASPAPAERFTGWWAREYFNTADARSNERVRASYEWYFALLDTPNKLWFGSDCVEALLGRLYRKVGGGKFPTFDAATLKTLRDRIARQDQAFAVIESAKQDLSLSQQRFFGIDVEIGLQIDRRHCQAALKLFEALEAPTPAQMWQCVFEARAALEQLEVELLRGEYPPFDLWYHETWLRQTNFVTNPHRPFKELRAFIGSEGIGNLEHSRQPWE